MAAEPVAALISLVLPRGNGLELAKQLYEGLLPLADRYNVAIAGGDTNSWDGPLSVTITAIGRVADDKSWLRGGAKVGDEVLVTGSFGGSILGRHLDFEPRVKEASLLRSSYDIHAAIDVSDGLSLDLSRLVMESGCGALLDISAIPISEAARSLSQTSGLTPQSHALSDGEDFELILAVSTSEAERLLHDQPLDVPVTKIGQLVEQSGLWEANAAGELQRLEPRGYEHLLDK